MDTVEIIKAVVLVWCKELRSGCPLAVQDT